MYNAKKIRELQKSGVVFVDPRTAYIGDLVIIGKGTRIYPNVILEGITSIGKNCTIHSGVEMQDATISDECVIEQGTKIEISSLGKGIVVGLACHIFCSSLGENSRVEQSSLVKSTMVGPQCTIGPFAHIDHATILTSCKVGTHAHVDCAYIGPCCTIEHAQIRRSHLNRDTHVEHFAYVGDATIGMGCNISAGAVFCNYDGMQKNKAQVDDDVFVGSGTMLIAPLHVGECAFIAAGCVVPPRTDVPAHALAKRGGRRSVHAQGLVPGLRAEEVVIKEGYVTRDASGWHIKKPQS